MVWIWLRLVLPLVSWLWPNIVGFGWWFVVLTLVVLVLVGWLVCSRWGLCFIWFVCVGFR